MGKELEKLWKSEDYWAIWFALILVLGIFFGAITTVPKVAKWVSSPLDAFPGPLLPEILLMGLGLGVMMAVGMAVMTGRARPFFLGYLVVFAMAVLSYFLAQQTGVKA